MGTTGECYTATVVKCISSVQNQMGTLLSSPCQLELCHDLAKQLSHYLYFFFSFSFLLSWTYYTEESVGKCHVTSVT